MLTPTPTLHVNKDLLFLSWDSRPPWSDSCGCWNFIWKRPVPRKYSLLYFLPKLCFILSFQDVTRSKAVLLVISLSGIKVCSSNGEVSVLFITLSISNLNAASRKALGKRRRGSLVFVKGVFENRRESLRFLIGSSLHNKTGLSRATTTIWFLDFNSHREFMALPWILISFSCIDFSKRAFKGGRPFKYERWHHITRCVRCEGSTKTLCWSLIVFHVLLCNFMSAKWAALPRGNVQLVPQKASSRLKLMKLLVETSKRTKYCHCTLQN